MALAVQPTEVGITPSCEARPGVRLSLLGGFGLARAGHSIPLPVTAQRVVVFLALHQRPLQRVYVSGMLWPNSTEDRAGASLRSALWRLHRLAIDIVGATGDRVWLAPAGGGELTSVGAPARQLIDGGGRLGEIDL